MFVSLCLWLFFLFLLVLYFSVEEFEGWSGGVLRYDGVFCFRKLWLMFIDRCFFRGCLVLFVREGSVGCWGKGFV